MNGNDAQGYGHSRGHKKGRGKQRPAGLRGREIGLFYAMQQRKKEKKNRPMLVLGDNACQAIEKLTENFSDEFLRASSNVHSSFLNEYNEHLLANTCGSKLFLSSTLPNEVDTERELRLFSEDIKLKSKPKYQRMLKFREALPAFKQKQNLIDLIRRNQVIVVSGETGCGKTTQVPQFILDDAFQKGTASQTRIICTQPRRISAISVAERVAEERGESGVGNNSSVGYQIRLECRQPREFASISFCTTGVVLQWMKTNPSLDSVSHIILDEIHERDILSDFLITLLRDLIRGTRKDLKVILMSATLNANKFSRYFSNCPLINIPGFTHPVQEFYLEDVLEMTRFRFIKKFKKPAHGQKWKKFTSRHRAEEIKAQEYGEMIAPFLRDMASRRAYSYETLDTLSDPECENLNLELIATLLKYIHFEKPDGAILVFLPGWTDISSLFRLLTEDHTFRLPSQSTVIYPLHSLLPKIDQIAIFQRPRPGVRKVILATNIAETSITIDDVVYVVDSGKIKLSNFDRDINIQTLQPEWVALANSRQRRGRAGRVQPGICYHLYSRAREMTLDHYVLPEILRTRLESVILQIKSLGQGDARDFFSRTLDPPDETAIHLSIELLKDISALRRSEENLTPLGFHLSRLPLDPQAGKMVLCGAIFGCLDPILTIAASLSFKDPFVVPLSHERDAYEARRRHAYDSRSDHIALVNVFNEWENAVIEERSSNFCWKNYLSESTLRMLQNLKSDYCKHLFEMKFIESQDCKEPGANRNSSNVALVRAVVCAGLYPNVAKVHVRKGKRYFIHLETPTLRKVKFHPKSVNSTVNEYNYPWVIYHQIVKSESSTLIHDSSMVSPFALLFFGKYVLWKEDVDEEDRAPGTGVISADSFVNFNSHLETATLVQKLRHALDVFLKNKAINPGPSNWTKGSKEGDLLRAIVKLVSSDVEGLESYAEYDDEAYNEEDD